LASKFAEAKIGKTFSKTQSMLMFFPVGTPTAATSRLRDKVLKPDQALGLQPGTRLALERIFDGFVTH
jgi:hypothetical protein